MEISKINVNGTPYDIQDSRVNATDIATMLDAANYVPSAASSGALYSAGTGISISANNEISIDNSVYTTSNPPTDTNTTYSLTVNGTTNGDANGTSLGTLYAPTTAGTSGQVWKSNGSGGEWGNVSTTYGNVTYSVYTTTTTGSVSLNYNNGPIQVVTLSGAATSVTVSNLTEGHSLHVFFVSSSSSATRAITIAHDNTNRRCPAGANISLTAPKSGSGYCEVDFLKANSVTYVRGV